MKQPSFASIAYDTKKKKTKKEIVLDEMERVMPVGQAARGDS